MEIIYTETEKRLLVAISGRLDNFTADTFLKECQDNIFQTTKQQVIIECSNLIYISSAGLRVVLMLIKKLGKERLRLCGVSGLVQEVIDMVGFATLVPIYATVEEIEN